ncbi:MAG: alcohol dehydrogenase catalytic domain-containing protein [Christensenella sp.]|nr:alcohol dehydrogenase catalytic domain-containing protein [Christensenella sp.]
MTKMMKAQVVEAPYKMVLKEVPVPEINDDEVLIKIKYCGICGSDWSIFTGKYAADQLPLITGHEMFGEIAEVGKNAKGIKVGDRVAVDICLTCGTCYFCRRGDGLLCKTFTQLGIHTDGGFAEYVKAPWKNIYPIPDSMDDYTATFVEPLTATLEASKRMDAKIASSCVVIGCGLGVVHALLAKLRGCAPVILVGDSEKRLKIARDMGIDYTINIKEVKDPVAEVKKLTGGVGADYAIEAVGHSSTYEQAFQMLRRGGKLEAFGVCATDDYAKLPPYEFVLGEKHVSGSCAGIGNDWGDAIRLLEYKRINPKPLISMVVPLEELEDALKELRENPNLFKVLVSPEIHERIILND